jgi:hypothetical protein
VRKTAGQRQVANGVPPRSVGATLCEPKVLGVASASLPVDRATNPPVSLPTGDGLISREI